jgi:hypothetical protein
MLLGVIDVLHWCGKRPSIDLISLMKMPVSVFRIGKPVVRGFVPGGNLAEGMTPALPPMTLPAGRCGFPPGGQRGPPFGFAQGFKDLVDADRRSKATPIFTHRFTDAVASPGCNFDYTAAIAKRASGDCQSCEPVRRNYTGGRF